MNENIEKIRLRKIRRFDLQQQLFHSDVRIEFSS